MFELIRKIVNDSPLVVQYSKVLKNYTVVFKDIAILYVGDEEECEEFVNGYQKHLTSVNYQYLRVS
ncbi:MAG: hypothetical protein CMB80_32790 [Flammeovirgaceae bacterium]|nr:hypothetical protein [Flammeovirgaceae bacterium]MBE62147.1 hypothetical protein [Flammeovirgaceae bacterium]MBR10631.1 hypothetical protein [Rickettsiales bacterium]HCX22412.1 hypothetical protein [Cytophagales bacterium]|tara:strand:+ start:307 stop:504 length:198 start_codon:yes stop_codon:yes gene_type:complete